jgi:hypothetical protein
MKVSQYNKNLCRGHLLKCTCDGLRHVFIPKHLTILGFWKIESDDSGSYVLIKIPYLLQQVSVTETIYLRMYLDISKTSSGFNELVDYILLVGANFQTDMGYAGIMKGGDQVGYKLQNQFPFMLSSEHYQLMGLEFVENVLFRVVMDCVFSGLYRTTLEVESGRKSKCKNNIVDLVPQHERAPRCGHTDARQLC